jgi:cob(I)alamin adenosyltransferase
MKSIATRTGDHGTTGLMFGQRVPKSHPRVEAVGRFDELNAALGMAKAAAMMGAGAKGASSSAQAGLAAELEAIQRDLVPLMGELASDDADQERYLSSKFGCLTPEALARVDAGVARLEGADPPLRFDGWATPGKTPLAAALDMARVAARRAERHLVAMRENGAPVRDLVLQYINRVSDLLWLLARQAEG